MSRVFFQVFLRWGRVKSEFFERVKTENQPVFDLKKRAFLRVKKLKNLFLSKISGGEKSMSGGEFPPPTALRKKTLHVS